MNLERLQRTLGRPELEWLLAKLTRRLERGSPLTIAMSGTIKLRELTAEQREALGKLLGRPIRPSSVLFRLAELEKMLQHAGLCTDLREAVEALTGPVVNRREESLAAAGAWSRLFRDAEKFLLPSDGSRAWLENLEKTGLLRRLTRNDRDTAKILLEQALGVAARLPANGISLAELAASVTGDSHALDPGSRLHAVVLRLVARISGFDTVVDIASIASIDDRRSAWAGAGVLCDELSAPVLILNLCGRGDSATETAMRVHAGISEPYRLSTRQLLRETPAFHGAVPGNTVFVCENPAIVAAAANRLGSRSAPLLSIEGQPKTAAHLLLSKLRAAQVRLVYHGDFDWPGVQIGNLMRRRYGVEPWRFCTGDYLASPKGKRLQGRPCSADWDPDLMRAMLADMKSIHEEAVMDTLLEDLSDAGGRNAPVDAHS